MALSRLLDRSFRVGVTLKGLDGGLELIGGIVLLFTTPEAINHVMRALTQHELSQDPNDFIARHLLHSAGELTHGTALFAAVYLITHGVSKIVLVVALLRDELWAYPAMIVLLAAFIVYQLYRLVVRPGVGLVLLTAFDALIVWLTGREYRSKRRRRRSGHTLRVHRDHRV